MTKGSGPNITPPLNGGDGIPETTVKQELGKRQSYVVPQTDLLEKEKIYVYFVLFLNIHGELYRRRKQMRLGWKCVMKARNCICRV